MCPSVSLTLCHPWRGYFLFFIRSPSQIPGMLFFSRLMLDWISVITSQSLECCMVFRIKCDQALGGSEKGREKRESRTLTWREDPVLQLREWLGLNAERGDLSTAAGVLLLWGSIFTINSTLIAQQSQRLHTPDPLQIITSNSRLGRKLEEEKKNIITTL